MSPGLIVYVLWGLFYSHYLLRRRNLGFEWFFRSPSALSLSSCLKDLHVDSNVVVNIFPDSSPFIEFQEAIMFFGSIIGLISSGFAVVLL